MASLPSDLTPFLSAVLPRGFALGPSLLRDGSVGLWWVGPPLEAGVLLGRDGDTQRFTKRRSDSGSESRGSKPTDGLGSCDETALKGSSTTEEAPGQRATWFNFACQARCRAQRNVAVCGDACLRACRYIGPGTELLVYDKALGKGQMDDLPDQELEQDVETEVKKKSNIVGQERLNGAQSRLETLPDGDNERLHFVPPVRASSRLAAKPRRVHRTSGGEESVEPAAPPPENAQIRQRRHRCSSCGKSFYQLSHLRKHQFSHTEEKPFSCGDCGKNYTSSESFRAHQMSHRGERPFSCPHCEKTYGLKRDLKEHLVLHTGETPYTCENCDKSFARRPSLRIHRLLHCSRKVYTQSPKVQCSICSKQLANPNSLRIHMKLHTGEKPHICQSCGKRFSQKGNLESHLRIHSGERPYPCPDCPQTFTQKSDLQRHALSHAEGGFLCSYCGRSLRDPHSLRYHERLHTGERPHRCSVCGKGYTMATKLRRHMRSCHLKEKPYGCSCGATFTLKQSLLRHQAQHRADGGAQTELENKEANVSGTEAANESGAPGCDHLKPTRGRPRKTGRPPKAEGEEKQTAERTRANEKWKIDKTSTTDVADDPQQTVIYVHTEELSAGTSGPLIVSGDASMPAGTEPGLLEVVISDGGERCIVVQGRQAVGELLILQEEADGLSAVAQTVEINSA